MLGRIITFFGFSNSWSLFYKGFFVNELDELSYNLKEIFKDANRTIRAVNYYDYEVELFALLYSMCQRINLVINLSQMKFKSREEFLKTLTVVSKIIKQFSEGLVFINFVIQRELEFVNNTTNLEYKSELDQKLRAIVYLKDEFGNSITSVLIYLENNSNSSLSKLKKASKEYSNLLDNMIWEGYEGVFRSIMIYYKKKKYNLS